MKKKTIFLLPLIGLLLLAAGGGLWLFSTGSPRYIRASETVSDSGARPETEINPHTSLSVPSCITKIGTDYFIVDTYHDQIICSDSLSRPLQE